MPYVLIGNFGDSNLGDEMLRSFFESRFGEIQWTVLSASPKNSNDVPRLPLGIRSLLGGGWMKTIRAIKQSRGVVFGGGSLFTDTESLFACILWWWHARVARLLGRKIFLAYQGIGPFQTALGERLARSVALHASFISVRDEASYARVVAWGIEHTVIHTFDPVFSLLYREKRQVSSKNVLVIIPRKNTSQKFEQAVADTCRMKAFDDVRIVSLQPDDPAEQMICRRLREACGRYAVITPVRTIEELLSAFDDAALALSQRYHGSIAAIAGRVPCESFPQTENDKLASLRDTQPSHLPLLLERLEKGETALRKALTLVG